MSNNKSGSKTTKSNKSNNKQVPTKDTKLTVNTTHVDTTNTDKKTAPAVETQSDQNSAVNVIDEINQIKLQVENITNNISTYGRNDGNRVNTFNDFSNTNKRFKNNTSEEILTVDVSDILKKLNLKQYITELRNTFLQNGRTNVSIETLSYKMRSDLGPYQIRVTHEPINEKIVDGDKVTELALGRILLSSSNYNNNKREINAECNGVVIDGSNLNVLAIPAPVLAYSYNANYVRNNISKYYFVKIRDGTTVTLYWYKSAWRMSSAGAYELNDFRFIGDKTYWEMFSEVVPADVINMLDKTKSYVIGFRHHNVHPFLYDKQDYWFVDMHDVAEMTSEFSKLVRWLKQNNLEDKYQKHFAIKDIEQYDKLINNCNFSTKYFLENVTNDLSKNYSEFIYYGIILRRKWDDSDTQNSDIVIMSDLLNNIRKFIYNVPKKETVPNFELNNVTILNYMCMKQYFNEKNKSTFIKLFPQFNNKFAFYRSYIDKIVTNIYNCIRNNNYRKVLFDRCEEQTRRVKENNSKYTSEERIDQLVKAFTVHLKEHTSDYPSTIKIINDFICRVEHIHFFKDCLEYNAQ